MGRRIWLVLAWMLPAATGVATGAVAAETAWGPAEVVGRTIEPGTADRFPFIPDTSYQASLLNIPVFVARGARPGPTLCLTAGIHGDEISGVEVARRAFVGTDPTRLSGMLITLPMLNADGFRSGSRYLPDRRDLNRYFPGSSRGSVASIIAGAVFTHVIRNCDALIDLHTASFHRTNAPQIRVDVDHDRSFELARHFGGAIIIAGEGPSGSLRREAVEAGVPAIIYEAGEPMRFELDKIEPGVEGVRSVMRFLGMIEGEADVISADRIFVGSTWSRVPTGKAGFFFPEVGLGDRVTKGQTVGYVVDPLTDVRTPALAHRAGEVIGAAVAQPVLSGYALFHIGEGGAAD
ncbi:MAG: succinylglutamate desuccinylase/aspartoacylase family protein [Pseudomonadales bacterium]